MGNDGVERELAAVRLEAVTRYLHTMQETVLEALVAVDHKDGQASERMACSRDQRMLAIVQRLLAGEPVSPTEQDQLGYEISGRWHLGVTAKGTDYDDALRQLKATYDCELLLLHCDERRTLAWLGTRREREVDLRRHFSSGCGVASPCVAAGEPAYDLGGWRQTHREAQAAMLASLRSGRFVRYGDKPILVAALENETLYMWLKRFAAPVREHPDGPELMRTARAYIDAECNSSSAAHALKNIRRQTVGSRMRTVEALVERPLRTCLSELDAALCVEGLDGASPGPA